MGLNVGEIIGLVVAGVVSLFLLYIVYILIMDNLVPSVRGVKKGVKRIFTKSDAQKYQDSRNAADDFRKVQEDTRAFGKNLPPKGTELTPKQEKELRKTTQKYADSLRKKSVVQSKITRNLPLSEKQAQEQAESYLKNFRRNTVIPDDFKGEGALTEEDRRNFLDTGFTGSAPGGQSTSTEPGLFIIPEQGSPERRSRLSPTRLLRRTKEPTNTESPKRRSRFSPSRLLRRTKEPTNTESPKRRSRLSPTRLFRRTKKQ